MKFPSPKKKNVARHLPRPAPARTGESREVMTVAYRLCGDRVATVKIAKFFLSLKQTRFPDITLPEAITFMILESLQEEFVFQQEYASGRLYRGGAVIDFWLPNRGLVIRVQGDYWHSRPERMELDLFQKTELAGATIDGKKVESVVDIWESRLLGCGREHVVRVGLQGEEVGQ